MAAKMKQARHNGHSITVWADQYGQTHYSANPDVDGATEFAKAVIRKNAHEDLINGTFH